MLGIEDRPAGLSRRQRADKRERVKEEEKVIYFEDDPDANPVPKKASRIDFIKNEYSTP